MPGKFERKLFAQIDLNDSFFDSLKQDYPEFAEIWFPKGIAEGREALVFYDELGLGAFIAIKFEDEPIELQEGMLPSLSRKIGRASCRERV